MVVGPFALAAAVYMARGWPVIPTCWPDGRGRCGCGWGHVGKPVGKAPRIPKYDPAIAPAPASVATWIRELPTANVAQLLEPAGLVVVDCDNDDAEAEVHALGLPRTRTVRTGQGRQYIYRRPPACPRTRRTKAGCSEHIDLLAGGITIAPPSRHRNGNVYRCLDPTVPLAEAPAWVVRWLQEAPAPVATAAVALPAELPRIDLDTLAVPPWVRRVIVEGTDPRYRSRSEAIHAVSRALVAAGYDDIVIAAILLDPRFAISAKPRELAPRWDAAGKASRRWVRHEVARARAKSDVEVFA
jgi:hypothetical protein